MIKFRRAILRERSNLIAGFENAIRISMHETYKRCTTKPQEPDFVAMLMLEGVPYIDKCLLSVLTHIGLKTTVSSVFCHQRPEVKFTSETGRCELGDILIVHRHKDAFGMIRNNALLLQAKLSSTPVLKIHRHELHQLKLYAEWPEFEYVRSGRLLNGQIRNVIPKISHPGAQYLLIDNAGFSAGSGLLGFPRTHCMAVWPAEDYLIAYYSLSEILFQFMLGLNGRLFKDNLKDDTSGWSEVIWDILSHSASNVFNRRNSGVSKESRLGGNIMMSSITNANFYTSEFSSFNQAEVDVAEVLRKKFNNLRGFSDYPPNNTDNYDGFEAESGVSVLLIETEFLDDENRN